LMFASELEGDIDLLGFDLDGAKISVKSRS
jgi:hypothetical protein